VETVDIELAAHHSHQNQPPTTELGTGIFPGIGLFALNYEAETALVRELTAQVFEISAIASASNISQLASGR
jgi:hypothetical protein